MFERGLYEELINFLMGAGFNEHEVGLYIKELGEGLFIIDFIEKTISKKMGSTSIDGRLVEGPEGFDRVVRFLEKHRGL